MYFIPLWIKEKYSKKLYNFLNKNIVPDLKKNKLIHEYYIDNIHLSGPSKCKRILNFTCSNKDYAFDILEIIKTKIKEKFNVEFI